MGEVATCFGASKRVGIDTSVFIYYLEPNPTFLPVARAVLREIHDGNLGGVASTLVIAELITRPYRDHMPDTAAAYENVLLGFPHLQIRDFGRSVARSAARIRARYGFRLPDALHLATAVEFDADSFITNDRRLQQFDEIPVTLLTDFIH